MTPTSWLDLGGSGVSDAQARRQTLVAQEIAARLRSQPGLILADEVGMGKTFATFGVIALGMAQKSRSYRALVVAPNRDLVDKWTEDRDTFAAKPAIAEKDAGRFARRLQPARATTTADVLSSRRRITIATMAALAGGMGPMKDLERAFLVEAAVSRKGLKKAKQAALRRRCGVRAADAEWAREEGYLGLRVADARAVAVEVVLPVIQARGGGRELNRAIRAARTKLVRDQLKQYDLLVVDEAHKLRSPKTLRYRSLRELTAGRFRNVLFLTATPFQLAVDELGAVLALLQQGAAGDPKVFRKRCGSILDLSAQYQDALTDFSVRWARHPDEAALAEGVEHPALTAQQQQLRASHQRAVELKSDLQSELREVMIRGVKDKSYRTERLGSLDPNLDGGTAAMEGVQVPPGGRAAYAISVALLHEYERSGNRTYGPVQLQSLTSSYNAFFEGHLGKAATLPGDGAWYRDLLRRLSDTGQHPKIAEVVASCVLAARAGLKTVVFTERLDTAPLLATEIAAGLEPKRSAVEAKRLERLRSSFWDRRSPLSLLLRDNLLHSYFPLVAPKRRLAAVLRRAAIPRVIEEAFSRAGGGRSGARRDLPAAVAAVEAAVLDQLEDDGSISVEAAAYARSLLALRVDDAVTQRPVRSAEPAFDIDTIAAMAVDVPGLWAAHGESLLTLPPKVRDAAVRAVRTQVLAPQNGVLSQVHEVDAARGGRPRHEALAEALQEVHLAAEPLANRLHRFLDLIATREPHAALAHARAVEDSRGLVTRMTGREEAQARELHRYAFNCPFPPWVAIASGVAEVGVDLQRECSRVIHHDLAWNPATLEQRVGRVDRVGSRTERLLVAGDDAELFIGLPYIRGTIDERIWRRVRERRHWMGVFLGEQPALADDDLGTPIVLMPESVTEPLRMDLDVGTSEDEP